MKTPTVHVNGTSRRALLEQVTNAFIAGDEFRAALRLLTQHTDANETVRSGHIDRELNVQSVLDELVQLAQHIDVTCDLNLRPAACFRSNADLLGQIIQVADVGSRFLNALQEMTPHGRDYYPQGDVVIHQARAEHARRMCVADQIHDELWQMFHALNGLI